MGASALDASICMVAGGNGREDGIGHSWFLAHLTRLEFLPCMAAVLFCARLQMCYDFSGVPRRFGSHQLSCEVNKTAHVRASAWCVCVGDRVCSNANYIRHVFVIVVGIALMSV